MPGPGEHPLPVTARFELWPHDADVGVRGFGPDKAIAFAQAGRALTALVTDITKVRQTRRCEFACGAADDELLLVAWLNEVIYAMATQRMLFADFAVELDGTALRAVGHGETVDPARHEPAVEPKGATLTGLRVDAIPGGWLCQCVIDV